MLSHFIPVYVWEIPQSALCMPDDCYMKWWRTGEIPPPDLKEAVTEEF